MKPLSTCFPHCFFTGDPKRRLCFIKAVAWLPLGKTRWKIMSEEQYAKMDHENNGYYYVIYVPKSLLEAS